ncbi:DUF4123 domain-containing protein [Aeromonas tecta]|uniref:DUF4123 domain-containing protein n=1 Tax=Aeromonas tecta TaxID=324617 RepID=UPI000682170C|nr:DUF4123 domain-containing protein [Aeromonas tecta]
MISAQNGAFPDIELSEGEQLYLMLDGARIDGVERVLFEQVETPAYQPLYLYSPWDSLREVSPCLVCVTPILLEWFIQNRESSWGYLLSSRLPLLPMAEKLRSLIEAESPYASRILLKLAMPETMWRLFMDDEPWLWQGVGQVWIPMRRGSEYLWWHKKAKPELDNPVGTRFRLSDPQWEHLGEVSWLHVLDGIREHMLTWFPDRWQEQAEPDLWLAHWAEQAYGMGFESERDLLLFFNVLGYLGSHWYDEEEHPGLKTLITQASAQTPSQRIEQAAELAETLSKKDRDA